MARTVRFIPPPDDARDESAGSIPDLGPNGPQVLELLQRAAQLSPAERRRLGEIASFRWWPLTLPVGGPSAGARATAILSARRADRRAAVAWIEATATPAALGGAADPLVVLAVGNAGIALLARDVISDEVFDALYGPWREVTHR